MSRKPPAPPDDVPPAEFADLDVELLPIDGLEPHPRNPQQGDVGAVATAIAVDGWHGTITAQAPEGDRTVPRIIVGHTRWRALALLQRDGFMGATYDQLREKVALPPPGFAPVQVVPMDDVRAARKMLADNQASALALSDNDEKIALLRELSAADALLGSLFDGDDLDALISGAINQPALGFTAPPNGDEYDAQFGVIVVCTDEKMQAEVYEILAGEYEQVRVVTV